MENTFSEDVLDGLMATNKSLKSKYFYDDNGSRIFQDIMNLESYYLTNCELEIFREQAQDIFDAVNFDTHFNLIELGAGDGLKTSALIAYLLLKKIDFTYIPIDISQEANNILKEDLLKKFPTLKIKAKTGDYFEILAEMQQENDPALVLFIGSNIGNYTEAAAANLISLMSQYLKSKDKLLIGVDLKKNPVVVSKAYNDDEGITKAFNLNLLKRINTELSGEFNLANFDFYSFYNPQNGEVRSYIVSLVKQTVRIGKLSVDIEFRKGETIWTELSKKYDHEELEELIESKGLVLINHFVDRKNYFTDSLFSKK
jgi:L-histidine N-alpha-methyltransferase